MYLVSTPSCSNMEISVLVSPQVLSPVPHAVSEVCSYMHGMCAPTSFDSTCNQHGKIQS